MFVKLKQRFEITGDERRKPVTNGDNKTVVFFQNKSPGDKWMKSVTNNYKFSCKYSKKY